MIIQLDNDNELQAAIDKVEEECYYDALCLFSRVDSYESMLNQIGCLGMMHDLGYAMELYRKLLARYGVTHNCFHDFFLVGDVTNDVMALGPFIHEEPDGVNKMSADEDSVAYYAHEEFIETAASRYVRTYEEEEARYLSEFYDLGTHEYYQSLCRSMERCYEDGDYYGARDFRDKFIEGDSDTVNIMEMQVMMCVTDRNWTRAKEIALRLCKCDEVSARAVGAMAVVFNVFRDEHADLLHEQLKKWLDLHDYDRRELIHLARIAGNCEQCADLVPDFADALYDGYDEYGCTALRLCAQLYCNCGQRERAREAVLDLLRAMPQDAFGKGLMHFIDYGWEDKFAFSQNMVNDMSYFDVPDVLAKVAEHDLVTALESKRPFGSDEYSSLELLCQSCRAAIMRDDSRAFSQRMTLIVAVLETAEHADSEQYTRFLVDTLNGFYIEPFLYKKLLGKLLELGYRKKIYIAVDTGYYTLDLSKLTVQDKLFYDAFTLSAALHKVNVAKTQTIYKKAVSLLPPDAEQNYTQTVKQLSYCMLAASYKTFARSREAMYFSSDEKTLYEQYVKTSEDK